VSLVGLAGGKKKELGHAELNLAALAAAGSAPRRAGRLLNLNSKVVPKAAAFLTVTSTQTAKLDDDTES